MFTELHGEEKREKGDRGGQEDRKGNQKERDRSSQQSASSLGVLHSPEHTKKFTELGREEKGEGGDRGDLVEKKRRVQKGREQSVQ